MGCCHVFHVDPYIYIAATISYFMISKFPNYCACMYIVRTMLFMHARPFVGLRCLFNAYQLWICCDCLCQFHDVTI